MRPLLAGLLLVLLTTPGCAWVVGPFHGPPSILFDVPSDGVPRLIDDLDSASLRTAIERSIAYYDRKIAKTFMAGGYPYSGADFADALRELLVNLPDSNDPAALEAVIRSSFQ